LDLAALIRIVIVISVMLIVVALGLRYTPSDAGYLLHRRGLLLRSLIAMNVALPVIAIWIVTSFDLRTPVKVALVALAASPLPPLLPGKQLNLSSQGYVYGVVVAAAVCSIFLLPATAAILALRFHTRQVSVPKVFLVVAVTVLVPLGIGLFTQWMRPTGHKRLAEILSKSGIVLLGGACVPAIIMEWPTMRSLLGDGTAVVAVILSAIGLLVGHILGGPDPENRTVLALATASRHPGVAMVAASASFQPQRLVTAAVLLTFIASLITSVPYAAWRKRVHAAANATAPAT